ncbi:hypothetical protein BEWA_025550 [Theileria equi strain WA]|uniref:Inner membrane complex protein n=1 Tax=Theileria equi strain WA TaxID=1537102 RepID=L0AXF4_THEEQ|nr:hypothetical protein BEWA_025550 [Theileria equi strain WA]AFZ79706.1 hypothetical protein BEWA_025550 [Theileria equi strain WA]|eukprot:XP_004829372.1 hypothetical protein BEWA_025550 [Theileria equi strain WA]
MDYSVYQEYNPEVNKTTNSEKNDFSFYECPTAAASIQEFGDYSKSNSLDSDQDYSVYDVPRMSISLSTDEEVPTVSILNDGKVVDRAMEGGMAKNGATEGGSVSFTRKVITGGYFGGSDAMVYSGTPRPSQVPRTLLNGADSQLGANINSANMQGGRVTFSVAPPASQPNVAVNGMGVVNTPIQMTTTTPIVNTPKSTRSVHTLDLNGGYTEGVTVEGSYNVHSPAPVSGLNAMPAFNVLPVQGITMTNGSPISISGMTIPMPANGVKVEENKQPIITSPSVKDYSRAVKSSGKSETTFVQEGFDTICVPRYRPVEIVEKRIEVPVVHHVDTFVPKREIQEIENIVKKPYTKVVDKIVEVPQIHYTDKIVEVPEYHEVVKSVPKIEVQERTKYVPKVQVKVVPKYVEVPVVKFVDRYEEVEEVEEVVKHVEKVEVVEVPKEVVKHVVKPVKKIVEQERIIPVIEHRDVPVEKVKFVPKIETVELLRQVPKVIDVPVPYNVPKVEYVDQPYIVPKYRDIPVAVPVMKRVHPVIKQENVEYVDVPVHRPYFVIHDHLNFKDYSKDTKENLRVVNVNQVNLETVDEAFRQECQDILNRATNSETFAVYR